MSVIIPGSRTAVGEQTRRVKSPALAAFFGLCSLGVVLVASGCASSSRSASSPSGNTLLGRWVARPAGAPCDFELELLQDGSARSNYLNDDSRQQLCAMHSLRFSAGTPQPDSLDFWLGNQAVRYCFYQLSGASLALTCDEHRPPDRTTSALLFRRPDVNAAPSTGSIVGVWRGAGLSMEFTQDGRMLAGGGSPIGYRVLNGSELELLYARPERCSYEFRGANELLLGCASFSGNLGPLLLRR
jgi:hypothetical protein